jgi:hypothetical protein
MLGEAKPKNGLRGRFTETVQSIFGGNEPAELRRLLREELAPFVDGPALSLALTQVKDDVYGDLVDQFAILALALDRPTDVPATCMPLEKALKSYVEQTREILG